MPVPVTILSGQSLSAEVDLVRFIDVGGPRMCAISMPAAWTAASLTFQVSYDNGVTYQNVYDSNGNEYTVSAAAGSYILLDPATFITLGKFKIRSGTAGSPVNQAADRTLNVIYAKA